MSPLGKFKDPFKCLVSLIRFIDPRTVSLQASGFGFKIKHFQGRPFSKPLRTLFCFPGWQMLDARVKCAFQTAPMLVNFISSV